MRHFCLAITLVLIANIRADAAIITQFNFNSTVNDANVATGSLAPSTGTGSLALIGGTTSTFATGSSTDPNTTDNSALNTAGYPTQGTASGTAGVRFNTSTAGFTGLSVSFDLRQSNTASEYFQLQASADGTNFTNVSGGQGSITTPGTGNTASLSSTGLLSNATTSNNFVQGITYTFAAGSIYENDSTFAFRLVSVFAPGSSAYAAANATSTYGTTGTIRLDMVTFSGTASPRAVPEPTSVVLMGLGLIGSVVVARQRLGRDNQPV